MGAPAIKKRKVRKGTHSCWECRRRKIKCKFDENEPICINCVQRGSQCISQEFSEEAAPTGDKGLAHRLGRLEEMMGKLVETRPSNSPSSTGGKITIEPEYQLSTPTSDPASSSKENHKFYSVRESEGDLLDASAVRNAHDITIVPSGSGDAVPNYDSLPSPDSSSKAAAPLSPKSLDSLPWTNYNGTRNNVSRDYAAEEISRGSRYRQISQDLYNLLPSSEFRTVLAHQSPGAAVVLNCFHSGADQITGKAESPESLASPDYPGPDAHPAILARRLLQYAICLQYMSPAFYIGHVQAGHKMPCEYMASWIGAVSSLVTGNDQLIGSVEGLECLVLLSMFQGETGHIRKAWMTTRRALSMAQLMGLDRRNPPPLRSCIPSGATASRTPIASPTALWYQITCSDRYHSLILGLPTGSRNNTFADPSFDASNDSLHHLGKAYAVIAGRIADRNDILNSSHPSSPEAYALTQSIDADLEKTAKDMDGSWWEPPDITSALYQSPSILLSACSIMRLQCRHFTLMILLHLPYLLRDRGEERRYDYNRTTCMRASRAILERFLVFREEYIIYVFGRHIDYSGLIGAMTLMLGHLNASQSTQRSSDKELIEKARLKYEQLGSYKNDRLSRESDETISQMLPILDNQGGGAQDVNLTVPFLGKVNIKPRSSAPNNAFSGSADAEQDMTDKFDHGFSLDQPMSLSFDTNISSSQGPMMFDQDSNMNNNLSWDGVGWPDFSAELEGWTFQGIDTQYWSTLNNSMT